MGGKNTNTEVDVLDDLFLSVSGENSRETSTVNGTDSELRFI